MQSLKLTLYKPDNEIDRELTRSFVPWGILERAIDLQEQFAGLDTDQQGQLIGVTREHAEALTDFVVFVFDGQVTADELKRKASLPEMLALYRQIFAMVTQTMPQNPTMGQARSKQDLQRVRQARR
jgi:hypothetical protein